MRPTLWFCTPAYGRVELARICLRQLRLTCDALRDNGIEASAVVVADDENLTTARALGFATVHRDNSFVSKKFNDAIQFALDPKHNPHPADYIVPCGSDDWVDHRLFHDLPASNTVVGFQRMSFVREDGAEIMTSDLRYTGGSGIRIYPRQVMEPLGFRPADEDRLRACDTSILTNLQMFHGDRLRVEHRHLHDRQIVDWKTLGAQLNSYDQVARRHRQDRHADPFVELAGLYPDESLEAMAAHYGRVREPVAA